MSTWMVAIATKSVRFKKRSFQQTIRRPCLRSYSRSAQKAKIARKYKWKLNQSRLQSWIMSSLRCLNRLSRDRKAVLASKPIIESHSMRLNKELRQQDTRALSRRTFSRPSAWHRYLEHRKRSKRSEIYSEAAHWFQKRLLPKSL